MCSELSRRHFHLCRADDTFEPPRLPLHHCPSLSPHLSVLNLWSPLRCWPLPLAPTAPSNTTMSCSLSLLIVLCYRHRTSTLGGAVLFSGVAPLPAHLFSLMPPRLEPSSPLSPTTLHLLTATTVLPFLFLKSLPCFSCSYNRFFL
ncbi:hypothetical protein PIB30_093011, partial [Stylosanthes scabra]|nr:hypothetical protein [Stylosanthes scabra]